MTHLKKHDNLENALLWQDMPKTFCSGMSGNKYIITQGVTTSMEKNRIRPIPTGKSMRMSYQRQKEVLEMPNLIEVQKDSYDWFLRSGLKEVFDDISPISDYGGRLSLEFVDFTLCEDDVKYSIEECKQRDATYAAPLKVKVRLYNKEKEEITEVIQTLYRQTFLLERKFDKRAGRMQYTKEYRTCTKHLEFFKAYFEVAGITLRENVHMGVIYIQGEQLWGEKLPRLATIYLLVLKLLYDEQMQTASSSSHVVTTLGAVNGKAGEFHVLKSLPSITEMRRTIALLKKYQIIEPLDVLEELNESTRLVIYPCIHTVLLGDDIRELLATFSEEDQIGDEAAIQSTLEDMPE